MNKYLEDIDIKSYLYPWLNWELEAQRHIIKIAFSKDKPVGFVAFRFVSSRDIGENGILISKLAVHPDWRGLRIGTSLLNHVEDIAQQQKVNKLIMVLHEDNESRSFLIKKGFLATNIIREMFPDNCDGYRFRKILC